MAFAQKSFDTVLLLRSPCGKPMAYRQVYTLRKRLRLRHLWVVASGYYHFLGKP